MPQNSNDVDIDMEAEEEELLSFDVDEAYANEKALGNDRPTYKPHRMVEIYKSCISESYSRDKHQSFKDEFG
jgi:hypothetical protein